MSSAESRGPPVGTTLGLSLLATHNAQRRFTSKASNSPPTDTPQHEPVCNELKLRDYGIVLTGREFGQDVYKRLKNQTSPPLLFNFENVTSLESSFGEEIIVPFSKAQDNKIYIKNPNFVILSCLKEIAEENNLKIEILE